MYILGKYDGETVFGYTLNLNWNANHTSFNTTPQLSVEYAPAWSLDRMILSRSTSNIGVYQIEYKGFLFRYYEITYKYRMVTGSFRVNCRWQYKHMTPPESRWQQIF